MHVQGHYDFELKGHILYQYYHCHVSQPLLLEQLWEWGVDISSGQLNRILTENKDLFHKEEDAILSVGLKVSDYINVDDTGARHAGKNGYCTHIGNEFFAWFQSTDSKSRINFLELLRAGQFNILNHALCWIHAERTLNKLIPFSDENRRILDNVQEQVWGFYDDLKAYKRSPDETKKGQLEDRFDKIFTQKTDYQMLNLA